MWSFGSENTGLSFRLSVCVSVDKNNNVDKLSCAMLRIHMNLYNNGDYKLPWLEHVHSTLNNLGLTSYWHRQQVSVQVFKNMVKQRIRDQYLQTWNGDIYNNNLCYNYRMFETKFCFERHLVTLDGALRRNILKFRFSNHKLPIHSRRFLNSLYHGMRECVSFVRLESLVTKFITCSTVRMKE